MDSKPKKTVFIDLEEIIRAKSPRLAKFLPKFLINYIKHIVHLNDLNEVIENNKQEVGLSFIKNALRDMGTQTKVYGSENIPKTGRFIFASNHPLGGLDGMILINEVGKTHPNIK